MSRGEAVLNVVVIDFESWVLPRSSNSDGLVGVGDLSPVLSGHDAQLGLLCGRVGSIFVLLQILSLL
jgi:hypothetical protein